MRRLLSITSQNERKWLKLSKQREVLRVRPFIFLFSLVLIHLIDTYTIEELRKGSNWCLTNYSGQRHVFIGIRDRAQLLMSTVTAFRGESSRILLWSDLFITKIPIHEIKLGFEVNVGSFSSFFFKFINCLFISKALAALADNAKHNQTGRTDEHGALRHRQVELCAVGGLAMLFFAYFHILETPVPDFSPDFLDDKFGEWGRREWYQYHVFSTKDLKSEMTYES